MSVDPPPGALVSPSTARNRGLILEALRPRLPESGLVLEIASGAGEHAVYFAAGLPGLLWQPTDPDPQSLASITVWRDYAGSQNLLPPRRLDAASPESWPVKQAAAIVNINMIHISPWAAAEGLMRGASQVLASGGQLFMYGPFFETGIETAPSNLEFDRSLKSRNAAWGIRHLDDVKRLAGQHGLELVERVAMPANNLIVLFRRW